MAGYNLPPMFENEYMAHALGGYKGYKYLNCEEGLKNTISKGYQYLEVDLMLTDDDQLVCSHGWDEKNCEIVGMEYKEDFSEMTREKFLQQKVHGLTTMDGKMLYQYMLKYPELYWEIDLKTLPYDTAKHITEKIVETFEHNEKVLEHCLVQINTAEMYEAVDSVYHFTYYQFNVINAMLEKFDEVIAFCVEHKICAVALKQKFATPENIRKARDAGLAVLAYTVDDLQKAKKLLADGANTICTNFIHIFISQKASSKAEKHELYQKYHQYPLQMNKIVCSNFHGKGFGCNPKYIVNALLKKSKDLDIVWLGSSNDEFPEGVRTVPYNSEEAFMEIATARVLIDNQLKFIGFMKRPDQFYIETWHGAIPLKKIALDNPLNQENKKYNERRALNYNNIDLFTSNSGFCSRMCRRAFEYPGWILEEGYPRNDLLYEPQEQYKKNVCKMLHISEDSKLILYAPTFRTDRSLDAYQLEYQKVLDSLGGEWKMLIRLHPHVQGQAKNIQYSDRIINASMVPDMQELMAASDILVTDYSNIMFEFMISGRPCFIYATDIEAYQEERDYYFDIYHLPFPIATTSDELIERIHTFDQEKYLSDVKAFEKIVDLNETGTASEKVADIILDMVSDRTYKLKNLKKKYRVISGKWCLRIYVKIKNRLRRKQYERLKKNNAQDDRRKEL